MLVGRKEHSVLFNGHHLLDEQWEGIPHSTAFPGMPVDESGWKSFFIKFTLVFQYKENELYAFQVSQNITGDLLSPSLITHNASAIPSVFIFQIYPKYKQFSLPSLFPLWLKPSLSFAWMVAIASQLLFLLLPLSPQPSSVTV